MRLGEIYGLLALGFLIAGLATHGIPGNLVAFFACGAFGTRSIMLSYGERH